MTNGGGAGVMAADAAAAAGVPLCALSERRCAEARRGAAADLVARQPGRHHRRRAGRALHRDAAGPARRSGDSGAVLFLHAPTAIVRSDDIARACAPLVPLGAGPRDGLLARRRGGGRGAPHLRRRRRRRLRDAGGSGARLRACSRTYRRNQDLLLEAPAASENGPPDRGARAVRHRGALAEGRTMLDEARGEGAARGLRHPGRADGGGGA